MKRVPASLRVLPARLSFAFLFLFAFAAPSSARQLKIEKFSAEIFVEPDATLNVNETIEVNFIGAWHGLYRTIPVEYVGPQGFDYSLFVTLEGATDAGDQPLKVDSSRQRGYLRWQIYVPNAVDTDRTIHLRYRVRNGLRFLEDHDELYWNITGNEWDVPLSDVSAQVFLPAGVTGLRATDFTGSFGSRGQNAEVTTSGSNVDVSMLRPLGFHEGLTVVVGWDKGFVKEPGKGELVVQFLESNWPLFLVVPVFLIMFWLWSTNGRDPRVGPIAVQYAPPDGITPAEAGTLVDESAAMRDITATIVDLAVRGYLVIEEQEKTKMMEIISGKDYVFHLKKGPDEWTALKAHEIAMLTGIFGYGGGNPDVSLSSLHNEFYKSLPGIKEGIFDALMNRGYFLHRPDYVRSGYMSGAVVTAVLLFYMGTAAAQRLGMQPVPFFVAAILCGITIAAFGWFMPARTQAGAKALARVLGFEDFLVHVESDHMERISQTPETFEKYLPYAMALGVEKKWASAFKNIYSQPPSWYQGGYYGGGFYPIMFVSSLDGMTAHASSVMASAPRSSGGSGFGGGGSSGGGFGGGGGGGF